MLTNTFIHIPGIGVITEERLWESGIRDWDSIDGNLPIPVSPKRRYLLQNGNHWPDFDFLTLIPVDIHVGRLSHRFAFVETETKIKQIFRKVYPENPRLLSFAMFLLGAKEEMNICTKLPKCDICKIKIPKVYNACPYPDKL